MSSAEIVKAFGNLNDLASASMFVGLIIVLITVMTLSDLLMAFVRTYEKGCYNCKNYIYVKPKSFIEALKNIKNKIFKKRGGEPVQVNKGYQYDMCYDCKQFDGSRCKEDEVNLAEDCFSCGGYEDE